MKRILVFCFLIILIFSGCKAKPTVSPSGLIEVTLNLTYIPNIQFAPVYVAIDKGYFSEEGLDVKLVYGNEADYISLIGSNAQQFMIGSGEQVLLGRAQGLPVLTVLDWYKDYPVGIASLATANINKPQDLKGKSIGLPGLYGASYIGFEALATAAGLNDSDFELRSIGFTQVESLVTGQADAVVIYLANEPVQLRARGYEVNVMRVADYVSLVGNGMITNDKTVAEKPELVRSMVNALRRGILASENNPDEAYEISTRYVDNLSSDDAGIQKQILAESIKLWVTETEQANSPERWENMQNLLVQMGLMKQPIDITKAFNYGFVK